MRSPVCLVTGATSGIGLVTAEDLARRGARVIVAGRDPERTAAAIQRIQRSTGATDLDSVLADLSSQDEVRRMADEVLARHDRLDVLINNAGLAVRTRQLSPDGIELTWAVNHLGPFLLTSLLTDLLRASAPARVVTVSSNVERVHWLARLDLDDPQFERRRFNGLQAYLQSKVANMVFSAELAERLKGTGVTANCLHPGLIATGLGRDQSGPLDRVVTRWLARSPEDGAQTSLYLATSPEVADTTGGFYRNGKPAKQHPRAGDPETRRQLWELSARTTGVAALR